MSQNCKDTLLLPKTDFFMKADLVKREPERQPKGEKMLADGPSRG